MKNNKDSNRKTTDSFGSKIREIRYSKGMGIKKLAPQIGIDYSYLSKVENDLVVPSTEIIEKLSKCLNHDKEELLMLAGKVPEDVMEILRANPRAALSLLRDSFLKDGK